MLAYVSGVTSLDRYVGGFPVHHCPVCETGTLDVEERPYRVVGIARVRRTVRCDNCRSVLREVGKRRWRYAVDPAANEELYRSLNNRVLREDQLISIAPDQDFEMPQYTDDR